MAKPRKSRKHKRKMVKKTLKLKGGDVQTLFLTACEYGNLEEAQRLLQNNPDINISANTDKAFRNACLFGHLEVAQWLYSLGFQDGRKPINISANYEEAFREACGYGHLKVAEWLLQVKPNIDISANDDGAFRNACFFGRLEVAQWLYSLGFQDGRKPIDISAYNNGAFIWACRNRHVKVARWLQSLDPVAYNFADCTVNTKKEQQIKGLIYSMNQSGNENASTVDVVESLNEYIE